MNHLNQYNILIERAQKENRKKGLTVYYESHHILPKCVGGSNDKINRVLLTAKEHFVAHKLLVFIYPNIRSLVYALHMMMCIKHNGNGYRNIKPTSRDYAFLRELHGNTPTTEEHIKHLSESHKGIPSPKKGIPMTEEQLRKNSESHIGLLQSEETKQKRRVKMMGKNNKFILQYDKEMNLIKEWHSQEEAARVLMTYSAGIWEALNGKKKYFLDSIWKYK
jgi:hypothetical protein